MKKSLSIVLVLLLLLTACQALPDDDQSLASTPSSSSSITPPPSSSVVPPSSSTAPTVPTAQPTVPPTTQPTVPPYDICDGTLWYAGSRLCWRVKATGKLIAIADNVGRSAQTDTQIFYIKNSELTKIYVVTIGDFTDHRVYYESTYGDITYFLPCGLP